MMHVAEMGRLAVQYKENMELRMKHTDAPEKFMASELDLDEEVRR
jgi:hypothetical protein